MTKQNRGYLGFFAVLAIVLIVVGVQYEPLSEEERFTRNQREAQKRFEERERERRDRARLEDREPGTGLVPSKPDFELLEKSGERGQFTTEITGRIRNNTNRRYDYVQVTFDILDSQDQRVGTALANINGLKPGEIWKFEATYLGDDGARYRLDEITGF